MINPRWCITELGSVLEQIEAGSSFTCDPRVPGEDEVGVVKVSAVTWGRYDENESKTCTDPHRVEPDYFIQPGDFLFSRANTIHLVGACVIADGVSKSVMLSDKILRLRFRGVNRRWVLYFLRSVFGRRQIEALASGNQESMRNIGQDRIRRIQMPLPSMPEQERIVTAIESRFSRLDVAVAALTRAQANLKRARASVLKAAVEGRLVPTEAALARAEGRGFEPAAVLLSRILTERRAAWAASGARGRYAEPAAPDTAELPELPEGWCWTSVDAFLNGIQGGRSFLADNVIPSSDEVGIVKVSAVTWGTYNEDEAKTVRDHSLINPDYFIQQGDLLISRANTIELVGATVIADRVTRRTMLSDKILRLDMPRAFRQYVLCVLRSKLGRQQIESLATGNQESMRNIGQDRIRLIAVPLPPLAEQHRIVAEVDRRLSVLDKLAATLDTSLARCARLRQSILKSAFEGRLVPSEEAADAG